VPYQVALIPAAEKQFDRLSRQLQDRIVAKLTGLAQNPRPPDAKALQATEGLLRVRVGDYRIVYRVVDSPPEVTGVRIAHRSEVYR
jgi:mRNA interferase RelE/StbE